ncbi:MAG: HD domain-containing protein, partial [Magnetococcales bacterium]|nr:HD domain-containing protein [Magnetococcales bacterium]
GSQQRLFYHIMSPFCDRLFTQILGLCHLDVSSRVKITNGFLATLNKDEVVIKAKLGEVSHKHRMGGVTQETISATETLIPLKHQDHTIGMLYLEHAQPLNPLAIHLLQIFANQVSSALQTLFVQQDLRQANASTIQMLAEAAEAKDTETGEHVRRVVDLTRKLALAMGIDAETAEAFAVASQLHDVGKIGIPDKILNKSGSLDAEEFDIIRNHAHIGGVIIKDAKNFPIAREIALHHHERWDGSGYPDRLQGESIPLPARIVAVVDVFDALTHRRPYKKAWSYEEAAREIKRLSGTGFDPAIVEAFLRVIAAESISR